MNCKVCDKNINCHVFGAPEDICWGCMNKESKDEVVDLNAVHLDRMVQEITEEEDQRAIDAVTKNSKMR